MPKTEVFSFFELSSLLSVEWIVQRPPNFDSNGD